MNRSILLCMFCLLLPANAIAQEPQAPPDDDAFGAAIEFDPAKEMIEVADTEIVRLKKLTQIQPTEIKKLKQALEAAIKARTENPLEQDFMVFGGDGVPAWS